MFIMILDTNFERWEFFRVVCMWVSFAVQTLSVDMCLSPCMFRQTLCDHSNGICSSVTLVLMISNRIRLLNVVHVAP
jgi:hypothetical protein